MTKEELTNKIKELTNRMEGASPAELTEIRTDLSRLYANLEFMLGAILQRKPDIWLSLKYKIKGERFQAPIEELTGLKMTPLTDKETGLRYDMTQDGQDLIQLEHLKKGLDKILSSVAQRIALLRDEAHNSL
jgi:hypothetical protein